MNILKGFIKRVYKKDGALMAQVDINRNIPVNDVLLIFPYGMYSNPLTDTGSPMVLLFKNRGLNFAIPHHPLLSVLLEKGEVFTGNPSVENGFIYKANGDIEVTGTNDFLAQTLKNLNVTAETKITLNAPIVSSDGKLEVDQSINTNDVYKVNDIQVVSDKGAAVPDATGGGVIDAEARAAINTLLARLRVHGLIA